MQKLCILVAFVVVLFVSPAMAEMDGFEQVPDYDWSYVVEPDDWGVDGYDYVESDDYSE